MAWPVICAVLQDGDVVADAHQLFQPVRDVDDGHAPRLEVRDDAEQHIDFGGAQRRGRFVHDEDAGVERDGAGDLDKLLLADRQVFRQRIGGNAGFEAVQKFVGLLHLRLVVDAAQAAGDLAGGKDVFGDGEIAEQVQLLEDDADAVAHRVGRAVEVNALAIHPDFAERRPLDAGDDAHHRRFAGAVFADQHVHRAAPKLQVRLLQRHDAGIGLGNVLQFENDVTVVEFGHAQPPTVMVAGTNCGS
jgi:hypothetical protein